jgi:hypothetical protein
MNDGSLQFRHRVRDRSYIAANAATRMLRFLLLASSVSIMMMPHRVAAASDDFPSSERIFAALSACALNVNLTVDASIAGSLRSIFSDAAAQGRFSVDTTTSFLQLFPDSDKLKAYRAYRYCMFTTLRISAVSICGQPAPSPLTRVALGRFTVSGPSLVGREDILSTMLEGLLRKSRRYSIVFSESDLQAMQNLADADQLTAIAMTNDTNDCDNRAEQAVLPAATALGDDIIVNVRLVDVSSNRLLRQAQVQGRIGSPQELDSLMTRTWRGIEQGLAPESRVWRNGVGYCDKLKSVLANASAASCTGDETLQLMEDKKTNNSFVDTCQSAWRRNQGEPVCMFTCAAGQVTGLSLYKRLDATPLTIAPRSTSEQRAFIDKLKTRFGFTDGELAAVNIMPNYPDEDLADPEAVFTSTARDIGACLASWSTGKIAGGDVQGRNSDQGSKTITFSNGTSTLILELERWADADTRWNFVTAYFR